MPNWAGDRFGRFEDTSPVGQDDPDPAALSACYRFWGLS